MQSLRIANGINGNFFDTGGMYYDFNNNGVFDANELNTDMPTAVYTSRVSQRASWIGQFVPSAVPEPTSLTVLLLGAGLLMRRRAEV